MLTQTAEYALRAMSCLATAPPAELVPTTVLAERTLVPSNYLAKVLQSLAAANLIVGRRGVGGGYRLARVPSEITLLEIIETVSPIRRTEPLDVPGADAVLMAELRRRVDRATDLFLDQFREVTLEELTSEPMPEDSLCCAGACDDEAAASPAA